ncbi:hypothetical protein ABZS98_39455 [Streptomyces avermitilis]|uniref:hypothetical protein n=1 Tax=Streptomyces avermitilis TaxID=33903 RepID=UPI0033BCD30C
MPDATEIALITSTVPAALTFLLQRAERLISSRGSEPEEQVAVPDSLTGTLQLPLQPDPDRLRDSRGEIEVLLDALVDYVDPHVSVPPTPGMLRNLGRLRGALENVYGQHLTFDGEQRPASGPFVHQKADRLTGEATGMDADEITGNSSVAQDMGTVGPDAKLVGMKARRIGPQ